MSHLEHQSAAASIVTRCAIITLSDTRTLETDASGQLIQSLVERSQHQVVSRQLIRDDPAALARLLEPMLPGSDVDVIITTGGTGISQRDQTIDAIDRLIEHPLPGFGELFRMLSWQQIGSAAMLSRAVGGIAKGKVIFALPGSTNAVELAMNQLILPQLAHLVRELQK
ncbi:MAG: MogA/MoaB family molybdenum cofactor biosynthesis protein [Phycisphaerae bacterium]|nr:MogA/MoaB family molybdenum cofactor biosynthesis protein [Phycisphaerae bacterium]